MTFIEVFSYISYSLYYISAYSTVHYDGRADDFTLRQNSAFRGRALLQCRILRRWGWGDEGMKEKKRGRPAKANDDAAALKFVFDLCLSPSPL